MIVNVYENMIQPEFGFVWLPWENIQRYNLKPVGHSKGII